MARVDRRSWLVAAALVALAAWLLIAQPWRGPDPALVAPSSGAGEPPAEPAVSYPPAMAIADVYAGFTRPGRAFVGRTAAMLDVVAAGDLVLPTGRIVASDVFLLGTEPFTTTVARGRYPVTLLSATTDAALGADVAAAMVRFAPGDPASWRLALLAGQDVTTLEPGTFFGYGVDSGTGCFASIEAVERVAAQPDFDAYSAQLQAAMFPTPDARNLFADVVVDPATGANIIGFPSGFGDGGYASWFGLDSAGVPLVLVTDFGIIDAPTS
jgi:hypothetical protein